MLLKASRHSGAHKHWFSKPLERSDAEPRPSAAYSSKNGWSFSTRDDREGV